MSAQLDSSLLGRITSLGISRVGRVSANPRPALSKNQFLPPLSNVTPAQTTGPCSPHHTLHTARAPCIDYPTLLPPSTITTVDTHHHTTTPLCPSTPGPTEQFWLVLHPPRRQTRVTLTVTTLTTSTPPSWRGFTRSGLATPDLSSDQAGSFAEATSSSHPNWADLT